MAHVLAKLSGVKLADVKHQLETDASDHAEQGMYVEHLWRNSDNPDEILFLFRVNDLNHCKQMMNKIHADVRRENPDATLPDVIFLDDA